MQKLKYFIQFLLCGMICFVFACNQTKPPSETITKAKNKVTELMCGLSSPELQERKETVIASLQKQLIETKELENGYAFKFPGTDEMVDELTEFIKTEKQCCGFFIFGLSVSGDKTESWLELTGPEGSKDFIKEELAFI